MMERQVPGTKVLHSSDIQRMNAKDAKPTFDVESQRAFVAIAHERRWTAQQLADYVHLSRTVVQRWLHRF